MAITAKEVAINKVDPNSFSPRELEEISQLHFQIQALSGIVLSENEGSFSLQFLINVGQADEKASRTYIGGESVVKFENVQKFTSCLQMALLEATS